MADASPVPIILYSVPSNTTIDIPAEVAIQLSSHPNIIGIKDSGGNVRLHIHVMLQVMKEHHNLFITLL